MLVVVWMAGMVLGLVLWVARVMRWETINLVVDLVISVELVADELFKIEVLQCKRCNQGKVVTFIPNPRTGFAHLKPSINTGMQQWCHWHIGPHTIYWLVLFADGKWRPNTEQIARSRCDFSGRRFQHIVLVSTSHHSHMVLLGL